MSDKVKTQPLAPTLFIDQRGNVHHYDVQTAGGDMLLTMGGVRYCSAGVIHGRYLFAEISKDAEDAYRERVRASGGVLAGVAKKG